MHRATMPPPSYGVPLPPPPAPAEQVAELARQLKRARHAEPRAFVRLLRRFRRTAVRLGLSEWAISDWQEWVMRAR